MSKNPSKNSKPVKRDEPMNGAMKLFLAGCVAELYLLIIRRFYVSGTMEQLLACHEALLYILFAGLAVLVIGLALAIGKKKDKKLARLGWMVFAVGVFLAASSFAIRTFGPSALTLLCVVVPVGMLLAVLWQLYDRECAVSLTILAASLIVLWICRRMLDSALLGLAVKVCAVLYLLVLAAVILLARKADQNKGRVGRFQMLPVGADPLPVYVACGLSLVAVAAALFSTAVAYYAMWALAIVIFALAVYYTVKQL